MGRVTGIIAVKPEGDKESRMAVASSKIQAGEVLLPESAPWLADLEAELLRFSRQQVRRPMRTQSARRS